MKFVRRGFRVDNQMYQKPEAEARFILEVGLDTHNFLSTRNSAGFELICKACLKNIHISKERCKYTIELIKHNCPATSIKWRLLFYNLVIIPKRTGIKEHIMGKLWISKDRWHLRHFDFNKTR